MLVTLNAWVVTDDAGALLHAGNTPGGDGQVQWNMQLISHLLDHGLDPAEAVSAPRFTVFPGSDADVVGATEELRIEDTVPDTVRSELASLGHRVVTQGALDAGGSVSPASSAAGPAARPALVRSCNTLRQSHEHALA